MKSLLFVRGAVMFGLGVDVGLGLAANIGPAFGFVGFLFVVMPFLIFSIGWFARGAE